MNAQLAPIEAALTRAGIAYQVRGIQFFDRPDVRGAIDLVRRGRHRGDGTARWPAGPGAVGRSTSATTTMPCAGPRRRRGARADRRARHAARHPRDAVALRRGRRRDGVPRRARPATRGGACRLGRRRQPAHVPPGQGARVGRGRAAGRSRRASCRSARRSMTTSSSPRSCACCTSASRGRGATWRSRGPPSARRAGARPAASRAGSSPTCGRDRSMASTGSRSCPTGSPRTRARAASPSAAAAASGYGDRRRRSAVSPRSARGGRSVPARTASRPTSSFHDQTLAAIAEMKPPSAAALRRVKGVGPAKIEAYGDEVLELVSRLR